MRKHPASSFAHRPGGGLASWVPAAAGQRDPWINRRAARTRPRRRRSVRGGRGWEPPRPGPKTRVRQAGRQTGSGRETAHRSPACGGSILGSHRKRCAAHALNPLASERHSRSQRMPRPLPPASVRTMEDRARLSVRDPPGHALACVSVAAGAGAQFNPAQDANRAPEHHRPSGPKQGLRTAASGQDPLPAAVRGRRSGCAPGRLRCRRRSAAPGRAWCWSSGPGPSHPASRRGCRRWWRSWRYRSARAAKRSM